MHITRGTYRGRRWMGGYTPKNKMTATLPEHTISKQEPASSTDIHQPEIIHLQITERCNLACPKCYISELNTTPASQELKPETLRKKLFEPAAGCGAQTLVITGGEPYLSRQIYEIIGAARPLFDQIFVGTSGYFLNNEHCHRSIDAGIDHIQVSLDAVNIPLLQRLTGIKNVERLWENCERFIRIRNERQASNRLIAAVVIAPENAHEVIDVLKRCEAIGVDSITVQAYHEYGTVYFRERVEWPVFRQFDPDFIERVREIVEYIKHAKQSGSRLYPHGEIYFDTLLRFFEDRENLDAPCSTDKFLFVDSRGFIRGCLFSEILGHIDDGIENYLRSKAFGDFRRFVSKCHLCTHGCAYRPPMDA